MASVTDTDSVVDRVLAVDFGEPVTYTSVESEASGRMRDRFEEELRKSEAAHAEASAGLRALWCG